MPQGSPNVKPSRLTTLLQPSHDFSTTRKPSVLLRTQDMYDRPLNNRRQSGDAQASFDPLRRRHDQHQASNATPSISAFASMRVHHTASRDKTNTKQRENQMIVRALQGRVHKERRSLRTNFGSPAGSTRRDRAAALEDIDLDSGRYQTNHTLPNSITPMKFRKKQQVAPSASPNSVYLPPVVNGQSPTSMSPQDSRAAWRPPSPDLSGIARSKPEMQPSASPNGPIQGRVPGFNPSQGIPPNMRTQMVMGPNGTMMPRAHPQYAGVQAQLTPGQLEMFNRANLMPDGTFPGAGQPMPPNLMPGGPPVRG